MSGVRWWRRRRETPVVELQKSNPVRFGVVVLVITVIVVFFGFTKHIPYKHGFRIKAVFSSALNIRPKSPVRIAGVDVGKVQSVKRVGSTGVVTLEIEKRGLPIHADATAKLRPRIFLEGNFFVDLQPGSPSARTLSAGDTIPITHTSDPVQLDQVLDALNTDTRTNLQTFLAEYGKSLNAKPTAAEDAVQDPEVKGLDGGQALNKAYHRGATALRGGAIVSQALGGTGEHDISELVSGIERITAALNVHEQELGELIGNFNTFLGSFAAQSTSLTAAVAQLPGALSSANRSLTALGTALPSTRKFALDIIPGVEQTPATINAAYPWIEQTRDALEPAEIGGVAQGLRTATPAIAQLVSTQQPLFSQLDDFNQCLTKVIFPAGNTKLQDGANTSGAPDYQEFWFAMTGLAGAGQNFDGNGPATRFLTGGGGSTVVSPPASIVTSGAATKGVPLVARTPSAPQGTSPRFPGSEPPYKPLVSCDTQKLPEFNGPLASGPADGSQG